MFCGKCGTNNPDGMAFCSACGAPLGQQGAAQPEAPAQPVATTGSSKKMNLSSQL